jgi:hypothetical protein
MRFPLLPPISECVLHFCCSNAWFSCPDHPVLTRHRDVARVIEQREVATGVARGLFLGVVGHGAWWACHRDEDQEREQRLGRRFENVVSTTDFARVSSTGTVACDGQHVQTGEWRYITAMFLNHSVDPGEAPLCFVLCASMFGMTTASRQAIPGYLPA